MPGETHLRNIRQLTAGGENAEAYWAYDGSALIYQARKPGMECDQIFILDLATGDLRWEARVRSSFSPDAVRATRALFARDDAPAK